MKEKSKLASFMLQRHPWSFNSNPIWLASTLVLYRNVSKYPFPAKLDVSRRKQLLGVFDKAFSSLPQFEHLNVLKAEETAPTEKDYLYEHFLPQETFHQAHTGEGFAFDDLGEFLVLFNMHDHLQLQLTDCKGEIESSWNRLVKIETEVGKSIDYAFSSRFGFLTSDPFHCGTGLSVCLYLHLPALIHTDQLTPILERHKEEAIEASGLQTPLHETVGDIITLHNNFTLGLSEEDIIRSLRTAATKIIGEEKALRNTLKEEKNNALRNKVSRAYGLISYSYQLETVEALNALSFCKLALDLGWLQGITQQTLNDLLFKCRRAHLLSMAEGKLDPEELLHKRAELMHEAFKPTNLAF